MTSKVIEGHIRLILYEDAIFHRMKYDLKGHFYEIYNNYKKGCNNNARKRIKKYM